MRTVVAALDYLMAGLFGLWAITHVLFFSDILSTMRKEGGSFATTSLTIALPLACLILAIASVLGAQALRGRSPPRIRTLTRMLLVAAVVVAVPILVTWLVFIDARLDAPDLALVTAPTMALCATLGMI